MRYLIEVTFTGYAEYWVDADDEGAAGALATAKFIEEHPKAMEMKGKSTECTTLDTEDDEPGICPACSGSGEGMHEGTRCSTCKGKGES